MSAARLCWLAFEIPPVRYHTVIIGAGMSGLAAGIRLAYYQKPVCVLERHTTIGGLNSFYRLRARNHDVGLHAVTNFAAPGTRTGPLAKLLKQLRLRWDDFALKPQCGSAVAFPGKRLRFTNDFNVLVDEVASEFPQQIDGFRKLVATIEGFDELNLNQQVVSAMQVVTEHISDPLLVDMLFCPLMFYGSATPRDMDFNQFVVMFKSIFKEGFGRPFEGVRQILKSLTRHYKELGGELKLRHGVREIKIESGRAVGVILDDGREIEAENVLSTVGSVETFRLCGGALAGQTVPGGNGAVEQFQHGAISFNESISILDCQPRELGHTETIIFYNDSERFTYDVPSEPCDLRSGIICSPNNFQYDDGQQLEDGIVRITALANPDYWMNLPPDEYAAAKAAWGTKIIDSAVRFMPEFRSHVIDTDIFTPKTIHRFTGHLKGAVYGAPRKILTGDMPAEHLFLAGTDQGFLGIIGSMLSGITIANNQLLRE